MTVSGTRAVSPELEFGTLRTPRTSRSRLARAWRLARHHPLGAACLVVTVLLGAVAIFAYQLAPYDPVSTAPADFLQHPSPRHFFGTDQFGRDIFSRVLVGSRISLMAGVVATAIGVSLGALIGVVGAYIGGLLDLVIQRIADAIMALPGLVLLMVLATLFGPSAWNIVLAIAVFVAPFVSRIARGSVLAVKTEPYVEAARVVGAGPRRIMLRHVLPNILAPLIVIASITVGNAILVETAVSFLGLGVGPPTPTWGGMLAREGRQYMQSAPWLAWFPGLAIGLTVLVFNLLGDALRDVMDPRVRGR